MNILLIGYGKMGKTIEGIATERNHVISGILETGQSLQGINVNRHDVAIEFTQPESAVKNLISCFDLGIPVVSGTTGWLGSYETVAEHCKKNNGSFFYASNFSIGVNLFFRMNAQAAKLMGDYGEDYQLLVEEIHHTEKKDKPSGTAITLAEEIIKHHSGLQDWYLEEEQPKKEKAVPIQSVREPNVPGTHLVKYSSAIDTIELKHTAHSRRGFAVGAVVAAEWLKGKQGVFGMGDLLKDNS